MALPLAGYWTLEIIGSYLAGINAAAHPYQDRIDHLWSNILTHYFPLHNGLGTERESYVKGNRRFKSNIAITNLVNNRMHKVVVVEAKRFPDKVYPYHRRPGWENQFDWEGLLEDLGFYMRATRTQDGNVQTMYGMLTVGDMVRFYVMRSQNNPGNALEEYSPGGQQSGLLNIHTDQQRIHEILMAMSNEVTTRANTY